MIDEAMTDVFMCANRYPSPFRRIVRPDRIGEENVSAASDSVQYRWRPIARKMSAWAIRSAYMLLYYL